MNMFDVRLVTGTHHVPDPETPLLAEALTDDGYVVDVRDWRDLTSDWSEARVTVVRSPWDYVDDLDAFLDWAARVDAASELWNPLELLRWNTHKAYLLDLHARGAPIVPTVVLLGGSAASLDGICDAQGWNAVVVKPAVASGGTGARRAEVGDPDAQSHLDDLLARGDVLVQQFASSVEAEGEWSVVLVDGEVAHAVRKWPAVGRLPRAIRVGRAQRGRDAERGTGRVRDPRVRRLADPRDVRARRRGRDRRWLARDGGRGDRARALAR